MSHNKEETEDNYKSGPIGAVYFSEEGILVNVGRARKKVSHPLPAITSLGQIPRSKITGSKGMNA